MRCTRSRAVFKLRIGSPRPGERRRYVPCLIGVKPQMKNLRLIIGSVILGVLFCVSFANSFSVATSGERTTAVCISSDRPASRARRRRIWRLTKYTFRYTSQDGEVHSPSIRFGPFWLTPKVGESVPIVYAKGSPDSIYYDSVFHVWMLPAILGGVLIVVVARRLMWRRPNINNDHSV